jgi:hypothetical protein
MGAAVAVELEKPVDGSDILATNSLEYARNEVIRLRNDLGHLAKQFGVEILAYDASDICQGEDEEEDFKRCVREISHIRQCLRLNTQSSLRSRRTISYKRMNSSGELVSRGGYEGKESKYDDELRDEGSDSDSSNSDAHPHD